MTRLTRKPGRLDRKSSDGRAKAQRANPPDVLESDASEPAPHKVGYGHPPLHSRFKPGQSGNPKGRAKKSRNLRTILKEVFEKVIEVREGDRTRRMPRIEALALTTYSRAMKGDPRAAASLMVLLRASDTGREPDAPQPDVLVPADDEALLRDFLERHSGSPPLAEVEPGPKTPDPSDSQPESGRRKA